MCQCMTLKTNNYCQFRAMYNERNSTMRKKTETSKVVGKEKRNKKDLTPQKNVNCLRKK